MNLFKNKKLHEEINSLKVEIDILKSALNKQKINSENLKNEFSSEKENYGKIKTDLHLLNDKFSTSLNQQNVLFSRTTLLSLPTVVKQDENCFFMFKNNKWVQLEERVWNEIRVYFVYNSIKNYYKLIRENEIFFSDF